MNVFVLSRSRDQYLALSRLFAHGSGEEVVHISHDSMLPDDFPDHGLIVEGYRDICSKIDGAAKSHGGPRSLRNALAFIEVGSRYLTGFDRLTPIAEILPTWPSIAAMLVLAYPEIHWVFTDRGIQGGSPLFRTCHIYAGDPEPLMQLRRHGFTPLFDATGLRNVVRTNLRFPDPLQQPLEHVRLRDLLAAAIDDETSYAYFVAHTAYRFGFRTHLVTTFGMLSMLFGADAAPGPWDVTFEDISLNFADKPEGTSLASLEKRDLLLPRLADVQRRILVTYGYESKETEDRLCNPTLIAHLEAKGVKISTIYKPISGMFELSKTFESLLTEAFAGAKESIVAPQTGHGVPGRVLLLAEDLIARASVLMSAKESVEDCIQGAVLAGDALELLGNRVPTTAIEALSLKHELEVSAECMFPGLQSALDVRSRIEEIERQAAYLSERFHWKTRGISKLDTELGAVNRISKVMRENDRFDEDQECLRNIRRLRRELWFAKKQGRGARLILAPERFVRWYSDAVLNSLKAFCLALLCWVGAATIIFRLSIIRERDKPAPGWLQDLGISFYHAVENFISAHPPDDVHVVLISHHWLLLLLIPALVVAGFVHLAIFVAYLYSTIVRK